MLIEFLLVRQAGTSTFFLLMMISVVDVIGGFIVTLRTAQRDLTVERVEVRVLTSPVRIAVRHCMTRDFHLPGRSPVIACEGMAATSHPLATLAAIDVLRAGGNAADAAVTAVAVLCVVEPHMTGIGGDCFCLIAEPGKPVWGYNGCGRAGAKASTEALLAQGMRVDRADLAACGDRAGRDRGLGRDPQGARHALRSTARWRPPSATPSTASRSRRASPPTGARRSPSSATDPGATRHYLFNGRAPAEGDVDQAAGAGRDAEGDRQGRPARVLRRAESPRTWSRRSRRAARCSRRRISRATAARRRRRSRPTIAASIWSSCRRTARASPRWCCSTSSSTSIWARSNRSAPSAST